MKLAFASLLSLALAGCTIGRAVPYIPDPKYRAMTREDAKAALAKAMQAARTYENGPLQGVEIADASFTFRGAWGKRQLIAVPYAEGWPVLVTDVPMIPKELKYAVQFAREDDSWIGPGGFYFNDLEAARRFVDAYAAVQFCAGKPP